MIARVTVLGGLVGALVAGMSCEPRVTECVPGRAEACTCTDGRTGAQTCMEHEHFGPCNCVTSETSAGGGGAAPDPIEPIELASGAPLLLDVFVAEAGVYVVLTYGVRHLDRSGRVIAEWTPERTIQAAAFDGEQLAIANGHYVDVLDAALRPTTSFPLIGRCAAVALVSGARVVCRVESPYTTFHTYDPSSGQLVASSAEHAHHGLTMRRVPATDDFVTIAPLSGSQRERLFLHRVLEDGDAYFLDESARGYVRTAFAFVGTPASHVVTQDGIFLKIYGESCTPEADDLERQCLVEDGSLAGVVEEPRFAALDQDGQGTLYALLTGSGYGCSQGCVAQKIDWIRKAVLMEKPVAPLTLIGPFLAARYDGVSDGLVVGGHVQGGAPGIGGYRVLLIPYP
jgi:hypothetical protein